MNIKQFCEGIRLDPHAGQVVSQIRMDESLYESYKQLFFNDRFAFFERVKQNADYRPLFLYLFVKLAIDAYEEYQMRDIADDVYFDTFSDIQLWCMNCKRDFGEYGIEEYQWLQEHVQLRLFRLGRLQFQPYAFDREIEVDGKKIFKNQIALNVHIPGGESLDLQKVEESFERAGAFFRGISPIFMCNSWLLYPQLSEVVRPNSNIMLFQKMFRVLTVDHEARDAERYIFNKINSELSEYEVNTTLQRSVKAYLLAGNKLGNGYGVKI